MLNFFTHHRLLNLISVSLIAFLTYQIAIAFWHYANTDVTGYVAMPFKVQQSNTQNKQLSKQQLIRSIIQSRPFGQVPIKQQVVVQTEEIQAPETQLNYKLRGIYYSENKLLTSAIVEINNKDVQSYALKEAIEEGITIHAIELKHIVLERYGKFETLTLEEIKFDKKNKSLLAESRSQPNTNQGHNTLLKRYKKRFLNNPMALARKFRATQVTENGKNIGFRLKAVRGETLLKKLNVPDNAIFTTINGVGLDKPFQALDALKSLQTSDQIDVTYLINGAEESRSFELK